MNNKTADDIEYAFILKYTKNNDHCNKKKIRPDIGKRVRVIYTSLQREI